MAWMPETDGTISVRAGEHSGLSQKAGVYVQQ